MALEARTQFEVMYRAHADAVHAYCLRRSASEDAKDATADVFSVAWRRFDHVPTGDATLPWLFGVARNVLRDRNRAANRRDRLAAKVAAHRQPSVPSPELQVVRHSEHERVLEALNELLGIDLNSIVD